MIKALIFKNYEILKKYIIINELHSGNADFERYVDQLKENDPSLTTLRLRRNSIGDNVAKAIAEALKDIGV